MQFSETLTRFFPLSMTTEFSPDELAEEQEAMLTLTSLRGLSQMQAHALLRYYGSARATLADPHPALELWGRLLSDRTAVQEARDRARRECDFCREHHIRIFPYTSGQYPRLLQAEDVPDAPLALFYCGTGDIDRRYTLSVVGTRHITEYGKQMCRDILTELARLKPEVFVVSGLAYGVDIHTHREALANGLDTVAVLAHGLDRIYPSLHRKTARDMVQHGGLLTEYFTGTVPDKGNFVRRNRIVAGLSTATLVIESADKGGALITASLANSYNREVLAVPGRVTDTYSAGCNRLIHENKAVLVTSAEQLLQQLNWMPEQKEKKPDPQLFPVYTPEQDKVLEALRGTDGLTIDRLALLTQIPVSALSDLLFDLEDLKAVRRMPGNRYRLS